MADFYASPLYLIRITGWPADRPTPETLVDAPSSARLALWSADPADPADPRHFPEPGDGGDHLDGQRRLDLKPSANDPSQRWRTTHRGAGDAVPAPAEPLPAER